MATATNERCSYEWKSPTILECQEHLHIVVIAWEERREPVLRGLDALGFLGPKAKAEFEREKAQR